MTDILNHMGFVQGCRRHKIEGTEIDSLISLLIHNIESNSDKTSPGIVFSQQVNFNGSGFEGDLLEYPKSITLGGIHFNSPGVFFIQ